MNSVRFKTSLLAGLCLFALIQNSHGDGLAVSKVYHPYVQPLEKELEYRLLDVKGGDGDVDQQLHSLGFGLSPLDYWYAEFSVLGSQRQDSSLAVDAYEVEAKWQLSEQGEYALDWAALFELEKNSRLNQWEWAAGIIALKDWESFTATGNLMLAYEWGDDLKTEMDIKVAAQVKYRWMPWFEPGIEYYANDENEAVGPVALGQVKLAPGHSLFWQLGWLKVVRGDAPQSVLRASLEYEFF
jgi:hypothetical protein